MTLFYNVTTNPPPPPEKVCVVYVFVLQKHQTATGTLFTFTADYNFRKPLGLPSI